MSNGTWYEEQDDNIYPRKHHTERRKALERFKRAYFQGFIALETETEWK